MPAEYDIIVVGAGLIGSAAARHLVEISNNLKVMLIGPEEPQDKSATDVFGAHYDEGRVTRVLDPDPTWGLLAQRSINSYRDIERKSGIHFYNEVGFLAMGCKNGTYTSSVKTTASKLQEPVEILNHLEMKRRFPYLAVTDMHEGIYTNRKSGHISPRSLVAAQKTAARKGGCNVLDDIVKKVTPIGSARYEIEAERSTHPIKGKKVLLATGCFTDSRNLPPNNRKPLVEPMSITVLLAEVGESDLHRFRGMPSVISDGTTSENITNNKSDFGCFALPPIKYPNGRYYLKVGHGFGQATVLHTPEQLSHWHRYGSHNHVRQFLMDSLHNMFPDTMFRDYKYDYCAVGLTPTSQLYIDMVAPGLGVALGGCGYAAKSSDEIGRVAARMILKGSWDYDLAPEQFIIQWKNQSAKL